LPSPVLFLSSDLPGRIAPRHRRAAHPYVLSAHPAATPRMAGDGHSGMAEGVAADTSDDEGSGAGSPSLRMLAWLFIDTAVPRPYERKFLHSWWGFPSPIHGDSGPFSLTLY
jgi:hypothetical protein